jgi:hypothetical protein
VTDEGGALRADGVEDRFHVVGPLFEPREAVERDRVGQPAARAPDDSDRE